MVKFTDNSINKPSKSLSPPTGEEVVIDIGTGDGLFVYQSARQNPRKFYIGLDANPRSLEKISEKIHSLDVTMTRVRILAFVTNQDISEDIEFDVIGRPCDADRIASAGSLRHNIPPIRPLRHLYFPSMSEKDRPIGHPSCFVMIG